MGGLTLGVLRQSSFGIEPALDGDGRELAMWELYCHREDAQQALLEAMRAGDDRSAWAALVLGAQGVAEARPLLVEMLRERDAAVPSNHPFVQPRWVSALACLTDDPRPEERELYEAAAIDGAKEWQIFLRITLPMTTPILAVNALHAFVQAYNSWEWALLVCQRPARWTLAVWMYQMSQQLGDQPWAVMAGFVLVSIPTALVFIACQKIIMRGIVLPSMK